MTAKKTTTKKAAKETKAKSTRKTKAAEAPAEVATTPTGECPRGGEHEWTDSDEGRHCAKCLEPAGAPVKGKRGKTKAAAEATATTPATKTPRDARATEREQHQRERAGLRHRRRHDADPDHLAVPGEHPVLGLRGQSAVRRGEEALLHRRAVRPVRADHRHDQTP